MKRACVTGGCGFIGGRLAHALVRDGVAVTILDDLSTGSMANVPPNVSVHVHDVYEPWPELPPFDVCFHLAAVSRIGLAAKNPDRTTKVNVGGTLKALLRSSRCGAKLVLASSCTAAEPEKNDYARSKHGAEQLCEVHRRTFGDGSVAVARLFNVYGPGEPAEGPTATLVAKARKAARTGEIPEVWGCGLQQRDYIHVDDVVSALRLLASADADGRPYDVGTGFGTTVQAVYHAAGVRRFTNPPLPHPEMDRAVADPARLMALGWRPRHSLAEWLASGS